MFLTHTLRDIQPKCLVSNSFQVFSARGILNTPWLGRLIIAVRNQLGESMRQPLAVAAILFSCALLSACPDLMPLNSASPSYIKNVTSYKEGSDGIIVYIVLADSSGAMTTASGTLDMTISETKHKYSYPSGMSERTSKLFSMHVPVWRSSFIETKVGRGAFEHDVILLSLGRITYSSFDATPKEMTGKISVEFKTEGGKVIKGEDTILF